LLCGYAVQKVVPDYGIDLVLYTYDENGEAENGTVSFQVKATESLPLLQDQQTIAFPIRRADLDYWLAETLPVILIVYDAQEETAFWLYLQAYFEQQADVNPRLVGNTLTLYLNRDNVVDPAAMRQFAAFKTRILEQRRGIIHYDSTGT